MSEIDNQIAEIKARIDAGRIAKARAEATKESARAIEAQALAKLKEEFGVDNLVDARAKLVTLQNELKIALDNITEQLNEIEF